MRTPVALFIFSRPETTTRVFAEIARARPPRLLIVADGPRAGRHDEAEKCAAAREVVERVDWECEVLRNYTGENLGCRRRVSTGLDWVFRQCEEAIVLEDDCLPHPSFFPFCDALLERYRDDERVMAVCGDNYLFGRKRPAESYFFHRTPGGWGWATWRRAWAHYDARMSGWPALRRGGLLSEIHADPRASRYWRDTFDRIYEAADEIDTWDYQWLFSVWARKGFAATAAVNLVTNIGWGDGATHTRAAGSHLANIPAAELEFPLRHPRTVEPDADADRMIFENIYLPEMYAGGGRLGRLHSTLSKVIRRGPRT
ncbi:MAG TPA: hypothetical protein VGV38_18470 [Pyrinomonadaceae bacterium]|nr:hypothetical protein [Pyrinomonadaceae bacterium]